MARALDVILALTCDRDNFVTDVMAIAEEHCLYSVSMWEIVIDCPTAPEWMKIVAREEIAAHSQNVNRICDMLANL